MIQDLEPYHTWHGGPGALAVVAPEHEGLFHRHAVQFGIDTKSCGRITATQGTPRLWIQSQFGSGEMLPYPAL